VVLLQWVDRIGQGRENAKVISSSTPIMDKLEAIILAKHGIKRAGPNPY
jgi:hypothetical protein